MTDKVTKEEEPKKLFDVIIESLKSGAVDYSVLSAFAPEEILPSLKEVSLWVEKRVLLVPGRLSETNASARAITQLAHHPALGQKFIQAVAAALMKALHTAGMDRGTLARIAIWSTSLLLPVPVKKSKKPQKESDEQPSEEPKIEYYTPEKGIIDGVCKLISLVYCSLTKACYSLEPSNLKATRVIDSAVRALRKFLKLVPDACPTLEKLTFSEKKHSFALMAAALTSRSGYADKAKAEGLLQALVFDAAAAWGAEGVPEYCVAAFGHVLAAPSYDTFRHRVLLPAVAQAKRNAFVGLKLLRDAIANLGALPVGSSGSKGSFVVDSLIPQLVLYLKNDNAQIQGIAKDVLVVTSKRFLVNFGSDKKDFGDLEKVVTRLWRILNGGDGPVPYAAQRTGLIRTITEVLETAVVPGERSADLPSALLSTSILNTLKLDKTESNEDVREAYLRCVGRMFALGTVSDKGAVDALLAAPKVTEKEGVCCGFCAAVASAAEYVDNAILDGFGAKAVQAMTALVKTHCAKTPKMATGGICNALNTLFSVGDVDKFWDIAFGNTDTGALYQAPFFAKLKEPEQLAYVKALVKAASVALTREGGAAVAKVRAALFAAAAQALCSKIAAVRRAAVAECKTVAAAAGSSAFYTMLAEALARRVNLVKPAGKAALVSQPIYMEALEACVSGDANVEEVLPIVLVLAHHPLMTVFGGANGEGSEGCESEDDIYDEHKNVAAGSKRCARLFAELLKKDEGEAAQKALGEKVLAYVAGRVLREPGDAAAVTAAVRACRTVVAKCPGEDVSANVLVRGLYDALIKVVKESGAAFAGSHSAQQLALMASPMGTLYVDPAEAEAAEKERAAEQARLKKAAGGRRQPKRRGESSLYKASDEDFDRQVRAEVEAKRRAENAGAEAAEQAKRVAEQDAQRAALAREFLPVRGAALALAGMAAERPESAEPAMPALIYAGLALLRAHPAAFGATARALETAVCESLRGVPRALGSAAAAAMCDVYAESPLSAPAVPRELFPEVAAAVRLGGTAAGDGKLTPAAFSALVPSVKAVMWMEPAAETNSLHQACVAMISGHASTKAALPRGELVETIIHGMLAIPRFQAKLRGALGDVASGIALEEIQVLVDGVYNEDPAVSDECFRGIEAAMTPLFGTQDEIPLHEGLLYCLWLKRCDATEDAETHKLAEDLWRAYEHELPSENGAFVEPFKELLLSESLHASTLAASGLAAALDEQPDALGDVIKKLIDAYKAQLPQNGRNQGAVLTLDEFEEEAPECVRRRLEVVHGLGALARVYRTLEQITSVLKFLLNQAMADREDIRLAALEAGSDIVEAQGEKYPDELFQHLNEHLHKCESFGKIFRDFAKSSTTIIIALVIKFCPEGEQREQRIAETVSQLKPLLYSQGTTDIVRDAIARCFAAIARLTTEDARKQLVTEFLNTTVSLKSNVSERRGAAYALAGLLKGLGLIAVAKYGVVARLKDAFKERKPGPPQGALFAFELISARLQKLFEPYVAQVIPHILASYGDDRAEVRKAADVAARVIISNISAHCAKTIIPAINKSIEDAAWRTKKSSIELIGNMAMYAPQQTSAYLPRIVPNLLDAVINVHIEVRNAALGALDAISAVIRNPEIITILPAIRAALAEPTVATRAALDALETTDFEHKIDAPSLSLVIPVLRRGLTDSSETKKKSARIVGNMCALASPKDLQDYLPDIMALLRTNIVDPIPDVRSTTAHALGMLVAGNNYAGFEELFKWLVDTMHSPRDTVERSGAAQGLSEVFIGLGEDRLNGILPGLVRQVHSDVWCVREGTLDLFRYLPMTIPTVFRKYIKEAFNGIFESVVHEEETVWKAARKAGEVLTDVYWDENTQVIADILREAMLDDNWHVQEVAIIFMQKIFTKLLNSDPLLASHDPSRLVLNKLGKTICYPLFATIFMLRFEDTTDVSQKAVILWKNIITNPPKMLTDILTVFLDILVDILSSSQHRQDLASKALGDLVDRLSVKVLPSIVPVLQEHLDDDSEITRRGVCLYLEQIIRSSGKGGVKSYLKTFVGAVNKAICDATDSVSEVAVNLLDALCTVLTVSVIDDIIDGLLGKLSAPETKEEALRGINKVVRVRPKAAMKTLVPVLTKKPMTADRLDALVEVCAIADYDLAASFRTILARLVDVITTEGQESEAGKLAEDALLEISKNARGDIVGKLISEYLNLFDDRTKAESTRTTTLQLLANFLSKVEDDLRIEDTEMLVGDLVRLLLDPSEAIRNAANDTIEQYVHNLSKDSYFQYILNVRKTLKDIEEHLPDGEKTIIGFSHGKSIGPLLPLFIAALSTTAVMTYTPPSASSSSSAGNSSKYRPINDLDDDGYDEDGEVVVNPNECKKQGAGGIADLIRLTTPQALEPFVKTMIGPIIRISGDKFPGEVKTEILSPISLLLDKCPKKLTPFLPQLQTVFLKSLFDASKAVRRMNVTLIGKIVKYSNKVDQIVKEIVAAIATSEDADDVDALETHIASLAAALTNAGKTPSPDVLTSAIQSARMFVESNNEDDRKNGAASIAYALKFLPQDMAVEYITKDSLFTDAVKKYTTRCSRCMVMEHVANIATELAEACKDTFARTVEKDIISDASMLKQAALRALGAFFKNDVITAHITENYTPVITANVRLFKDPSNEVIIEAMKAAKKMARYSYIYFEPNIPIYFTALRGVLRTSRYKPILTKGKDVQIVFEQMSGRRVEDVESTPI